MPAILSQPAANGTAPKPTVPIIVAPPTMQDKPAPPALVPPTIEGFTWHEALLGTANIVLWIVLIDFGYLVRSSDYPYKISQMQDHSLVSLMKNLVMLLLSFSVSNVAMLCCVCGLLGAMADRSNIDGDAQEIGSWSNLSQKYASAVLRGFFVFLILMSGMVVVSGTDLSATTPQTYGHLAGTASLFSFLIGWDAHLFSKFVQKVVSKGFGDVQQTDVAAQQKVDKRSVDTAPDGSTHEEVTHAVTSATLSSASLTNSISNAEAARKPAPVGESKPSS